MGSKCALFSPVSSLSPPLTTPPPSFLVSLSLCLCLSLILSLPPPILLPSLHRSVPAPSFSPFPYFLFLGSLATGWTHWNSFNYWHAKHRTEWVSFYAIDICNPQFNPLLPAYRWPHRSFAWRRLKSCFFMYEVFWFSPDFCVQVNLRQKNVLYIHQHLGVQWCFHPKLKLEIEQEKKTLREESQTDCSELALQVQEDRVLRFAWCDLGKIFFSVLYTHYIKW